MKNFNQNDAYSRAKHKVDRIKEFYKHLGAYIIINSLILGVKIIRNFNFGDSFSEIWVGVDFYGIWLFWGIGLAFHAFSVFGVDYFLGKNWEEEKINQFMEEDERDINSNNR